MTRAFSPEEPDSQLPLDFQDTFGFLDLMDSSAYSQVCVYKIICFVFSIHFHLYTVLFFYFYFSSV